MKLSVLFFISLSIILQFNILAQDTIRLDLERVLTLALEESIDLKIAQSGEQEQEAAFQNANFAFRPQLFLNSSLANLNRSIESRPLPNGSDAFVNRSTMYNGIGLELNYQIEKTGGMLSIGSNIERLDVFKTDQFEYKRTYFINPIDISYVQPIFSFNDRAWQKERLSLLHTEFKERYARTREEIIFESVTLFKNCFLLQQKVQLVKVKIAETDSLIAIKTRLLRLGKGSKVELYRLTLNQINNEQEESSLSIQWKQAQIILADFIGINKNRVIVLTEPNSLENVIVPIDLAMSKAVDNKYVATYQARTIAEAKTEITRAKKNRDIDLNVRASLGLNNSDENLSGLLHPLLDRETFSASIKVPLTGWKRYKIRETIAEEQYEQVSLRQEKERIDLSREANILITDFKFLKNSLINIKESQRIAKEIQRITIQQFLNGDASYTDLNVSGQERESAILQYYDTLINIIEKYYQIRKICMFDFIEGRSLSHSD